MRVASKVKTITTKSH